jgi:hypothetical protein
MLDTSVWMSTAPPVATTWRESRSSPSVKSTGSVEPFLDGRSRIDRPRRPGKIGEQVEFLARQIALLKDARRLADNARERLRLVDHFEPFDALLAQASIGIEAALHHAGVEHGDLAFARQLRQEPLPQFLGRFQPGLVLVAVLDMRGDIEHQGRSHRRFLAAQRAAELHAGPRQGEGQQGDHRGAKQKQQQVTQQQSPLVHVMTLLDEAQRRKLQQLGLLPHDQVQRDRYDDQGGPGQK